MDRRQTLQTMLEQVLGSTNVYYQPPPNIQMKYPAILYERDAATTQFANNVPYVYRKRYQLTVIDRNPDSPIPDRVAGLPMTTHERWFAANGLNHDVFTLYF
jgi:hypothetical protein